MDAVHTEIKTALSFLIETRNAEKKAEAEKRKREFKEAKLFVSDLSKPLLPQIEKALKDVTRKDYHNYIAYLEKQEDTSLLQALTGQARKGETQEHSNMMQYLHLLLCDSKMLQNYLREGESQRTHRVWPAEREENMFQRMEKIKNLYDVMSERAQVMAGECIDVIMQGPILNNLAMGWSNKRETKSYKTQKLEGKYYNHTYPDGSQFLAIDELDVLSRKALIICMAKVYKNLPDEVFTGQKKLDVGGLTVNQAESYATAEITTEEYMKLTQKKDAQKASKALSDGITSLAKPKITKNNRGKDLNFHLENFVSVADYKNHKATITLTNRMLRYICSNNVRRHQFNMVLLTLDDKQAVASQMGFKLWLNYMMKQGETADNILSVGLLIDTLTELPRVNEVNKGKADRSNKWDKHLTLRIREPFEKALALLVDIGYLKSWRYTLAKGKEIPLERLRERDFNDWLTYNLEYVLNLPPQDAFIEKKRKYLAERQAKIESDKAKRQKKKG